MSEFDAWKEVANLQAEITRLKDANNELVEALQSYGLIWQRGSDYGNRLHK